MGLDINHSKPTAKTDETLDYFTIEELNENQSFIDKHKHLISLVEEENGQFIEVIFVTDIALQRKQMNQRFINDFKNGKPYFDIETVKKALSYVIAKDKNEQLEVEQKFKKDFIDNFIEGESIFWASW